MTRLKHFITGGGKKDKKKASAAAATTHHSKMSISEPVPVNVHRHNVDDTKDINLKQGDKPVNVVKPINSESPPAADPVLEKYASMKRAGTHLRSATPDCPALSSTIKKEHSRSCINLALRSVRLTSSPDQDSTDFIPVTRMSIGKRPPSRESSVNRNRSPLDSDIMSPNGIRSTSFTGDSKYRRPNKDITTSSECLSRSGNQSPSASAAGSGVTYRPYLSNKQANSTKHSSVVSSESGFDSSESDDYATVLEAQLWYHGRMNATVSEMLVHKEGDFLVWETQSRPSSHILTLHWDGRPQHVQVSTSEVLALAGTENVRKSSFKYYFDNGAFDSIPELVNNHLKYQIPISKYSNGVLTNPVCRPNTGVKELAMDHPPVQRSYTVSSPQGIAKRRQRKVTGDYAIVPPLLVTRLGHVPELTEDHGYGCFQWPPSTPQHRSPSESALHQLDRSRLNYASPYAPVQPLDTGSLNRYRHPHTYYNLEPVQPDSSSVAYSTTSLRRQKKKVSGFLGPPPSYTGRLQPFVPMSEDDERRVSVFGTMRKSKARANVIEDTSVSVGNLSVSSSLTPSETDTIVPLSDDLPTSPDVFQHGSSLHLATKQLRAASTDSDYVYMEGIKPTEYAMAFYDQQNDTNPHPFASTEDLLQSNPTSASPQSSHHCSPEGEGTSRQGSPKGKVSCQSELQEVEQVFLSYHVEELAQHLTLADAVAMQLIPRPHETKQAFMERLKATGACDGHGVGMETLGLPEGEQLWTKLMNRHHNLSQWVRACIVSSGDVEQRAKVIAKFVELARALQSACFGNVFAFFAIMTGLASSQMSGLSQTWLEFHCSYPELSDTFNNQLLHTFSALQAGAKVFALEYVSVPAIQSLGPTYYPCASGTPSSSDEDVESLMEDFSNFASSMEACRTMVLHCTSYTYNARKRLSKYKYNQKLFEYFLQDHPRDILHRMNLGIELSDHAERRRRFSVILQALAERSNNCSP